MLVLTCVLGVLWLATFIAWGFDRVRLYKEISFLQLKQVDSRVATIEDARDSTRRRLQRMRQNSANPPGFTTPEQRREGYVGRINGRPVITDGS